MELARELTTGMPLQIRDEMLPVRPKGECIVFLETQDQSPPLLVQIMWDPSSERFSLRVSGYHSASSPMPATREMATQIIAAMRKKYPDAVITPYQPTFSPLGP